MPWTRTGDNAATYPKLMATAALPGADERTVNEVAGWLFRCAFQSAAHMTDYVIDAGTAAMLGGPRTAELTRYCVKARLIEAVRVDGVKAWKLLEDPEFIHIRLRKEVEWERRQRNDTRDPRLIVPVRLRDGDQCRRCRVVVQWRGTPSNRKATIDHLVPGQAGTVETMYVACWQCNSARQDNAAWDEEHPLLAPPITPLYGKWTARLLGENGHPVTVNLGESDPASRTPHGPTQPQAASPVRPGDADPATEVTSKSHRRSPGTGSPGSGRVGPGLGSAGQGLAGSEPLTVPSARRRRGRRGRRQSSTSARMTPTDRQTRGEP